MIIPRLSLNYWNWQARNSCERWETRCKSSCVSLQFYCIFYTFLWWFFSQEKPNEARKYLSFVFAARNPCVCVCVARVCVEGSCNSDKHFARDISIAETTHERHHINIKIFLCFYNFLLHDSMKNFRVNKSRLRICFFRNHIFINKKF